MPLTRTLPLFLTMLNHCLEMASLTYADWSCHAHSNLLQRYDKTIINNIQPFLNEEIHNDKWLTYSLVGWHFPIFVHCQGRGRGTSITSDNETSSGTGTSTTSSSLLHRKTLGHYIERHLATDGTCQILLLLQTDKTLLFYSPANYYQVFLSTNAQ